jgi:ferrous iron transport protein A
MKLKSIFNWSIVNTRLVEESPSRGHLNLKSSVNLSMSIAYAAINPTDELLERADSFKPTTVSLDRLRVGTCARVLAVRGEGAITRRLMEMGVVPGAPVRVIKCAPLGDPLEVRVRNYHLALRRNEAQNISVVISDEEGC